MHIIIPMSGIGKRFIDAGYQEIKPLIKVDDHTIIEHVCNLFPGEENFTFICNSKHLAETNIKKILLSIKPLANIIEIPNHKKGPVYAVTQIQHLINDNEETIVNYCDFGTYWNYHDFLNHTRNRDADGAIIAYKGFHPHMLGSTHYAFIREQNQWLLEIKEKEPFTDNRMNEYASNGTYYFKKGSDIKKYFKELIDKNIHTNEEFYVSMVFNLLIQNQLQISIYEIQHMLQWGTPEDVQEYKRWSSYFSHAAQKKESQNILKNCITLIPLAGRGMRFINAGYKEPKPLIQISGKPMIIQATHALPKTEEYIFVTLKEHLHRFQLEKALINEFSHSQIVAIDTVTEGQAITCNIGLTQVNDNRALLIAAADNGMMYNENKFNKLVENTDTDAIIFTFRHHMSSKNNPQMYGWVKTDEQENAVHVSVKIPISDQPFEDHAIVGAFWFRKVSYFRKGLENLLKKNVKVNNEYYVDSLMEELIQLDYRVKILEVDDYICWGTPNDYKTFNYWQSFFHKAPWHPYTLEKDKAINKDQIQQMLITFHDFNQKNA